MTDKEMTHEDWAEVFSKLSFKLAKMDVTAEELLKVIEDKPEETLYVWKGLELNAATNPTLKEAIENYIEFNGNDIEIR